MTRTRAQVFGDLRDRQLLMASMGIAEGEPGFRPLADLDDDQIVTDLDYDLWAGFREDWLVAPASVEPGGGCGLLGLEALLVLALGRAWRRARR